MIDTTVEPAIPSMQAADDHPRRLRGRITHVSTLLLSSTAIPYGVVLEAILVRRTHRTVRTIAKWFFDARRWLRDGNHHHAESRPLSQLTVVIGKDDSNPAPRTWAEPGAR